MATRSIRDSKEATIDWITAGSGRRAVAGGIMPLRSLRIIFSVSSPFSSILAASKLTSDRPPALLRSLWHPVQYCLTTAVCSAGSIVVAVGGCETAGFTAGLGVDADCAASDAVNMTAPAAVRLKAFNEFFSMRSTDSHQHDTHL